MQAASSEARKATSAAIWLAFPRAHHRHELVDRRPVEHPLGHAGVDDPGATALTVMPRLASSSPSDLVALLSAPLPVE